MGGGVYIVSVFNNHEMQLFYHDNISLLVRCRKQIVGKGRINILIEHSALILFYSWLFSSIPTKMSILHLLLLIHFKCILSPFLADCCSAELECSALALEEEVSSFICLCCYT